MSLIIFRISALGFSDVLAASTALHLCLPEMQGLGANTSDVLAVLLNADRITCAFKRWFEVGEFDTYRMLVTSLSVRGVEK